jgi:hypothetical protein
MTHPPNLNPKVMTAVEALRYRVTIGDVAAQAGLGLPIAQQGVLTLAAEAGGHLQVADTGDIVYLFPENFREILRRKYFWLRLQDRWSKIRHFLYYLLRISFGIALVALIALTTIAIVIIITASSSDRDGRNSDRGSFPSFNLWLGTDLFRIFDPYYFNYRRTERRQSEMNFLEAVFSFLFGDGDPNADLEERRWQAIASVVRHNRGAVIAEQITPYLDTLGTGYAQEYEEYMLPTLVRFNGNPEVTAEGQFVYHFPELQQMAEKRAAERMVPYLNEIPWPFSRADSGQLTLAGGLGLLLLGLSVWLNLIAAGAGGFVGIIAMLSLGYSSAYLLLPLIRYFWLQRRNSKIEARNRDRQARAEQLKQADENIQHKLDYAQQFVTETIIGKDRIIYTTEKDLAEQQLQQSDRFETDWERRLSQSSQQNQ